MGLVYKIYFFHMPSAWMFLVAALVCRRREHSFPVLQEAHRRRLGARRRRAHGVVRRVYAGDRAAVGAEGVGRLVAMGSAAHLEPRPCS